MPFPWHASAGLSGERIVKAVLTSFRTQRQGHIRLTTVIILAVGLICGVAGTAAITPLASAVIPAGAGSATYVSREALTPGQALMSARATGRPAVVGSLTTASTLTTVNPAGLFTATESLVPVRAWRDGRWLALDPDLRHTSDGRLVPRVSSNGVSLSGGGSGTLAVLSNGGWTLPVNWPGSLPKPVISGPTATYPNVPVAGADLVVTVDALGGVSVVAEATDATAAQALSSIKLRAAASGLSLTEDSAGNLGFADGPGVEPVFTAQAPSMWDSAPLPAGAPVITDQSSGANLAVPSGLPAQSSAAGPGGMARTVAVPVAVSGGTITMTPPVAALPRDATSYPVYAGIIIAPDVLRDASAWADISSGGDDQWMRTGCLSGPDRSGPCLNVGYCDPTAANMGNCGSIGVARTLLRFPITRLTPGTRVLSADLFLEDVWTAACAAEPLQLWTIPRFTRTTGWASTRRWTSKLEQETFRGFGDAKLPDGATCGPVAKKDDVAFGSGTATKHGVRVTGGSPGALALLIQAGLDHGVRSVSLGLRAADESATDHTAYLQWRFFMNKPGANLLQFTYFHLPAVPSQLSSSPGGSCQASRHSPALASVDGLTLFASAGDPEFAAARRTAALTLAAIGPNTNVTFAAGYIGGAWPSQTHHGVPHPDFFDGQLADITITR